MKKVILYFLLSFIFVSGYSQDIFIFGDGKTFTRENALNIYYEYDMVNYNYLCHVSSTNIQLTDYLKPLCVYISDGEQTTPFEDFGNILAITKFDNVCNPYENNPDITQCEYDWMTFHVNEYINYYDSNTYLNFICCDNNNNIYMFNYVIRAAVGGCIIMNQVYPTNDDTDIDEVNSNNILNICKLYNINGVQINESQLKTGDIYIKNNKKYIKK